MIYNMSSFQNEVRRMIDEEKPITLMHLWVMVFENLDHGRYASNDRPHLFLKEVLCTAIKGQISNANFLSTENDNRKVYPIMRKRYNETFAKSEIYDRIFNKLIQNTEHAPFLYLNEQYDTLRHLAADPNAYADKLWNAMITKWDTYGDKSYIDVLFARARWLFKNHEKEWEEFFDKKEWEEFDVERIYKLLTVAIVISLNQQTWTAKETEGPKDTEDSLDILCRDFLYAGPPEVLPDFTLRRVFDILFSEDQVFAVKRARDDGYVMVDDWNKLTNREQLCILLPWLGTEFDLHPDSEEAATALMNNKIDENKTADRVRKFFGIFVAQTDYVWEKFVAHLKESLVNCRRAKGLKSDDEDDEYIATELNSLLDPKEIPSKSKVYFNRLSKSGTKVCLNQIARDKFWNGDQVDIFLPKKLENEEDADQLYRYIAAYVLIALCCLKVDGSQIPKERKAFKEALIHKIHTPMSVPIEEHEKVKRENESLKQELERQKHTNAEKETSFLNTIATLVSDYLNVLQINSPIERQVVAEVYCRENTSLNSIQISKILNCLKAQDESKSLVRSTNPHGWDNGGN